MATILTRDIYDISQDYKKSSFEIMDNELGYFYKATVTGLDENDNIVILSSDYDYEPVAFIGKGETKEVRPELKIKVMSIGSKNVKMKIKGKAGRYKIIKEDEKMRKVF